MKKENPIYKLIFNYHANMIEICNIRQSLGLISDVKAEETNKKNIAWVVLKQRTLEDLLLIKLKNFLKKKTEPLTTALSFYPRLKHSTKVSERHAMLICEKIPGEKFGKTF